MFREPSSPARVTVSTRLQVRNKADFSPLRFRDIPDSKMVRRIIPGVALKASIDKHLWRILERSEALLAGDRRDHLHRRHRRSPLARRHRPQREGHDAGLVTDEWFDQLRWSVDGDATRPQQLAVERNHRQQLSPSSSSASVNSPSAASLDARRSR